VLALAIDLAGARLVWELAKGEDRTPTERICL